MLSIMTSTNTNRNSCTIFHIYQIWDSFTGESRGSIDIAVQVLDFALSPMGDKIAVALSDATVQVRMDLTSFIMQ